MARDSLDELSARITSGARLALIPGAAVAVLFAFTIETVAWQRQLLLVSVGSAIIYGWVTLRRLKRWDPTRMRLLLWAGGFVLLLIIFATGATESPMLPVMVAQAFFIGLFAPSSDAKVVTGAQLALLWLLVLLEIRAGNSVRILLSAGIVSLLCLHALQTGLLIQESHSDIFSRLLSARDELLNGHAEQAQALVALSGEIAHELKNPLARVRGLAMLLAKDREGKSAERLAVLRREVERMQEILEEFLNFSRPLTPLVLEPVSLGTICEGVASLHEGLAQQRGVALSVAAGAPVELRCDPRKVRQILINLVQNALDASAPGTRIELVVGQDEPARTIVEVRDRGKGLPASLGERIFDPGVTTKGKGSGLGLTIARGLAKQHGGDLQLRGREGGGCIAELWLPIEPPRIDSNEGAAA
ncbi:MAG TPA: HAMP domain-containing sensor histidine kinase [Myxococcaceae bacterium]|nr:HAMP domain-containing sensor histidine kinase [Myxococcaceae bacterium]